MKTLLIWLGFISLLAVRWWLMPKTELAVGERVRLTVPTVDLPEYSDSATILRRGKWEARIKDYVAWVPGEVVIVEGVWDGKRIISNQEIGIRKEDISLIDRTLISISYVRRWAVTRLEQTLPEPEASLAVGILLGVRRRMPTEFYNELVKTGTLHIIAASGFNVMVVGSALMAILSRLVGKMGGIAGGIVGIWLYVVLAGASASVVRAGIMGSLTLMAYYWGRPSEAQRLLWVTAGVMLLINPLYIVDVGFQLSVAATWGLLYVQPWLQILKSKILQFSNGGVIDDYLFPTLAASVATAPVILYHFGRISLISPLANLLILPVVPLAMMLSALTLIVRPAAYLLYVPLWGIVWVIKWLG